MLPIKFYFTVLYFSIVSISKFYGRFTLKRAPRPPLLSRCRIRLRGETQTTGKPGKLNVEEKPKEVTYRF